MIAGKKGGPRVERLHYIARSPGAIVFRKTRFNSTTMNWINEGPADDAVGSVDEFQVTLSAGKATVEMLVDYSTVDMARSVVDPYLRAWEIQSFLRHVAKHDDFQLPIAFEFDRADIANPIPGQDVVFNVPMARGFFYHANPSPPEEFIASTDVRRMWLRWQEYQAGRESLPSMAYFCLTVVEASVGGSRQRQRQRAAAHFNVSLEVLNKVGDLVSEVGEEHELRKAHAREKRPYSPEERKWIELVALALMRRLGEVAYRKATGIRLEMHFAPITMADFHDVP